MNYQLIYLICLAIAIYIFYRNLNIKEGFLNTSFKDMSIKGLGNDMMWTLKNVKKQIGNTGTFCKRWGWEQFKLYPKSVSWPT